MRYARATLQIVSFLGFFTSSAGEEAGHNLRGSGTHVGIDAGSPLSNQVAGRLFFENGNFACPDGAQPIVDVVSCIEGADEILDFDSLCNGLLPNACVVVIDRPELPEGCLQINLNLSIDKPTSASLVLNPTGMGESCDPAMNCRVVCVKEPISISLPTTTATLTSFSTTETTLRIENFTTSRTEAANASLTIDDNSTYSSSHTVSSTTSSSMTATSTLSTTPPSTAAETSTLSLTYDLSTSLSFETADTTSAVEPTKTVSSTSTVSSVSSTSLLDPIPSTMKGSSLCGQSQKVCDNFGFVRSDCKCSQTDNWYQWICTSRAGENLSAPLFCDQSCSRCTSFGSPQGPS